MDLVERYVAAVRPLLPLSGRDDICAELTDAIRSRLEERAAELGRKPTKAEEEAVIQSFGHPLEMAGRYGPQRTLIGPAVYPMWWLGVRVLLFAAAVSYMARAVVTAVTAASVSEAFEAFGRSWGGFFTTAIFMVGLATAAGFAIERFDIKLFKNWRVADLKPMNLDLSPRRRPRRVESVLGVAFNLLAAGFLLSLLMSTPVIGGFDVRQWMAVFGVEFSDAGWLMLLALTLTSTLAQAAGHLVGLTHPECERPRRLWWALSEAVTVAACGMLLLGGGVIREGGLIDPRFDGTVTLDLVAAAALVFIGAFALIQLAWNLWRLGRPQAA